jgi:hypothetical protein
MVGPARPSTGHGARCDVVGAGPHGSEGRGNGVRGNDGSPAAVRTDRR